MLAASRLRTSTIRLARIDPHERLLRREQALTLYGHLTTSLVVTATAGLLLALTVWSPGRRQALTVWLLMMAAVLAGRLVDRALVVPNLISGTAAPDQPVRRFCAGALATALVWAAFPPVFYPAIGDAGRAAGMVVLAGMAVGSVNVLGASLPLAVVYCVALLSSSTLMLFLLPGRTDRALGILSLVMIPATIISARVAHRSVVGALHLAHRMRPADEHAGAPSSPEAAPREVAVGEHYASALARVTSTDLLTGLPSRTRFTELLSAMLAEARARGSAVVLLFFDLDDFKRVNDVRGHTIGDLVLRRAARLLVDGAGERAEVARWGGDEFVVAAPLEPGATDALRLAGQLREILSVPIDTEFGTVRLDVTVGVASFPKDGGTEDALIRAADVAMFKAKKERKGQIKLFDPSLAQELEWQHDIEQALRDAIANGEMSLVFQPIVEASTGLCHACEALLRWHHPRLGPITPSVFIPIAEASGQIYALGRWVLAEACRTAASWPDERVAVTVNVSALQLLAGTLLDDIDEACLAAGLPASRLQIEITESVFVGDGAAALPVLIELRRRGVQILLDDFGTGFSSLAYLGRLPLDVIKIDRGFVERAEADGFSVIQAILLICRAHGLAVTAEGVETETQRARLVQLGVDRLQGYLLSRPMPPAALAAWLISPRILAGLGALPPAGSGAEPLLFDKV